MPRSRESVQARSTARAARWYPIDAAQGAAAVAASLPVLVLVGMGYARRWITEDAFIDFRVVRHLLAGHGPVFNVAERVEAYTNPLWVVLLAGVRSVGIPLEPGAVLLGLALSAAGVLLAQLGAWNLVAPVDDAGGAGASVPLPLGMAVYAAIPVAWDFVTSGLESSLSLAWLGGVFWLLARERPARPAVCRVTALAIGLGPLIRPDLALFGAAFGLALLVVSESAADARSRRREWARLAAIAAAAPVAYQVFRMGYFAALVPNTALAKEATAANWRQGWQYTLDFMGTYALWFPLLLALPWAAALLRRTLRRGDRPDVAVALAPVLGALAHWLYVTRVGGDFMHGRLLLPTLFALLLPVATVLVRIPVRSTWRGATVAGIVAWTVVCGLWLRPPYAGQGAPGPEEIADERGFYVHHMKTANPVHVTDYTRHPYVQTVVQDLAAAERMVLVDDLEGLARVVRMAPSLPPEVRAVVALSNIGILGYLAGPDIHVVDRLGLADPLAARLQLEEGPRGRPGHEKLLPMSWVVARFGDPAAALWTFYAPAASALGCADVDRLLRAVQDPLTPSRFASNIATAWRFHRLRIPADPTAAMDALCGQPPHRS